MTTRPLVVSMTMALALSRPAGSDWASAGAAQMIAANKARTRIIRELRSRESRLAGESGFEICDNQRRNESRVVAAHLGDLTDQRGGDRADAGRGRNEHCVHVGGHGFVHAGELHLVIEI